MSSTEVYQASHIKRTSSTAVQNIKQEFVLAALRCTCLKVRLIENELQTIGIALKGNFIGPELALDWAEEVAPGCVGYVPEMVEGAA